MFETLFIKVKLLYVKVFQNKVEQSLLYFGFFFFFN